MHKQLIRDEFDTHLMGMLHAATKLGMQENDIVGQVNAAMAFNLSELPSGQSMESNPSIQHSLAKK
jgi:hypothetical protein